MQKIKLWLDAKPPYFLPVVAFVAMGLLTVLLGASGSSDPGPQRSRSAPVAADTLIPKGFVLVPIELLNSEALESLIGGFAIVDLFLPEARNGASGRRVAKSVRLIRAPLNPNQFAVLIKESGSQQLVHQGGPFIAVLQNPNAENGDVIETKKTRSRISYGY